MLNVVVPTINHHSIKYAMDQFLNEEITIIKENGRRFEDVSAMVEKGKISIDDVEIPVEEGDKILRKLPSGTVEKYRVLDRGYQEKFKSIPASYNMEVEKLSNIKPSKSSGKTIYNLHGNNSRVNINSTDSSINIVDKSTDEFFAELRETVEKEISGSEKEELIKRIEQLEKTEGTDNFPQKYSEFMAIAANHTTVLAPYFPALAQFLTQL